MLDRTQKRSASMPRLDALGCAGMQWSGVVVRARQLLRIWSRQCQAVIHLAIITPTEWDQIARSCRGMLVWAGEVNGRKLSVGSRACERNGVTLNIPLCGHALCSVAHSQSKRSANVRLNVSSRSPVNQITLWQYFFFLFIIKLLNKCIN